jgi:hypothetical protein
MVEAKIVSPVSAFAIQREVFRGYKYYDFAKK